MSKRRRAQPIVAVMLVIVIFGALLAQGCGDKPAISDTQPAADKTTKAAGETKAKKTTAPADETEAEKTIAPAEGPALDIGDTAEVDNIRAKLLEVSTKKEVEKIKAPDGMIFVILRFEVENKRDKDATLNSLTSFKVNADGVRARKSLDLMILLSDESIDVPIDPGKKRTGAVGVTAPENWQALEIVFQPFARSVDQAVFRVKRK